MFDRVHQQIERPLRVRLDELELRERAAERLDVVPVLHFVQSVLRAAVLVVRLARGSDPCLVSARLRADGQQTVHRPGHRDERLLDLAGGLEGCEVRGDVGLRGLYQVVVVAWPVGIRVVLGIEALLPLALCHFPELHVVVLPEGSGHHPGRSAVHDVGWISGGTDCLGSGAIRVEVGCGVCGEVVDGGRQRREEVVRARIHEGAFPVDAAIEEIRRLLDRPADLVAAVRGSDRVGVARVVLVARLDTVARQDRGLHDALLPLGEWFGRIVVVEVDPEVGQQEAGRLGAAGERIRRDPRRRERRIRRGDKEVQDSLVLRRVRVALLDHVVAPGEVAVELAARPRSARDDQPSVPVIWQPQQEARLARQIAGHAGRDLQPGNELGANRRAIRGIGRDDAAIRLGREGEGWPPDRVVLGRSRRVPRRQVSALDAGQVRESIAQGGDDPPAGSIRIGERGRGREHGDAARKLDAHLMFLGQWGRGGRTSCSDCGALPSTIADWPPPR